MVNFFMQTAFDCRALPKMAAHFRPPPASFTGFGNVLVWIPRTVGYTRDYPPEFLI